MELHFLYVWPLYDQNPLDSALHSFLLFSNALTLLTHPKIIWTIQNLLKNYDGGGVLIWPWNPTKQYRFPCSYSPSTVLTDLTLEPCTLASEKSGFYGVLGMLWFKYAVSCWSQIDLCPWGRSVLSGQFMFSCLVGSLIYWDRIPLCIPS